MRSESPTGVRCMSPDGSRGPVPAQALKSASLLIIFVYGVVYICLTVLVNAQRDTAATHNMMDPGVQNKSLAVGILYRLRQRS